jgi:two-component system KDP operon response regulator KdpE
VAPSFTAADLTVNFESQEVRRGDQSIPLSATEYRLLYQLVRNAGHVVPRETLLARVWGDEYRDQTDYLKVYVSRLRAKLEDDPERPRFILTERGLGYRFARAQAMAARRQPELT